LEAKLTNGLFPYKKWSVLLVPQNFFDYFPVAPKDRSWGLYATSFGQVRVPPNTVYPPSIHPEGRHFDWEQGRTLQDYQLIYIQEGRGIFESSLTKRKKLARSTLFLLFPGVWHRYRPDFSTGWVESWIELNGSYMDRLRRAGVIDPKNPVYRIEASNEIEGLLETAHHWVRAKPPGFSIRLGFLAVQILTLLRSGSIRHQTVPRRIERLISESQALLARDLEKNSSAEQIARRLGVGYSYFRREFKRQTGFSPKQYWIEIRHRRTRDLLRNTSLTVKEISERLGYHSPYHLSIDFSRRTGIPPTQWRSSIR
jgi:AraC-like DNA-binding protein